MIKEFKQWCLRHMLVTSYTSIALCIIIGVTQWQYLFIYFPAYALFLLWLNWEAYLNGLEMVERLIWGNTINYYKENNIPRPKVKFVLNKEKYLEKQQNGTDKPSKGSNQRKKNVQ